MTQAEKLTSPFSDEHYKALASVAERLTEIINRPKSCAYSRKQCVDSLSQIVGILGTVQINCPALPT